MMASSARPLRRFSWALAPLLVACAMENEGAAGSTGNFGGSGNSFGGSSSTGGSSSLGTGGVRPPEVENEAAYLAPVATGRFLWTANPLSGRVALIDATTLGVTLETAGDGPTQVLGLPEQNGHYGALVLNERSDDATLFRVDAAGSVSRVTSLSTHADANSWVSSPSGRFVIVWTDAKKRPDADPLQTFQDITLFELEEGAERALPLSVGARPSAIVFDAEEAHAYAVTDEGISVVELGAEPAVDSLIALSEDPFASPSLRDTNFAPDGSYAVVRNEGESRVRVVALPSGEESAVDLGSAVTDVDLAPDGSLAFAVLGLEPELVVIPLPLTTDDASGFVHLAFPGEQLGSVALNADASRALLYSTALGSSRLLLLDLEHGLVNPPVYRPESVISPVTALFAAPDPAYAVTFQAPPASSKKAGAFSLLSLAARRAPKIVATDATPTQIAFSPKGDTALVTVRSDALRTFGAYLVALANQEVNFISLESPPLSAGVVPEAGRAYIAQAHPEGRITFVSLEQGGLQTITGFELSARIRE
jgi:hypothetical protein